MIESKNLVYAKIGKNNYIFGVWFEDDLLPYLDKSLQSSNAHTIGSYWRYHSHFSKQFQAF